MGTFVKIGGNGSLFIGEDKILRLFVYDRIVVNVVSYHPTTHLPLDAAGVVIVPRDINGYAAVPIDMSGPPPWAAKFVVRAENASAAALIDKTPTVEGTYHVDPIVNTQRLETMLQDDPDLKVSVFTRPGTYHQSWKRMDADVETILAQGTFVIERATQV